MRLFFSFILIVFSSSLFAQLSPWTAFPARAEISCMAEDATYLYVGTAWGGVSRINKSTGVQTHYHRTNSGMTSNQVRALKMDSNGVLWIGTLDGLIKYDGVSWQTWRMGQAGFPHDEVNAIEEDANGGIWVGTNDGLAKENGGTWTVYNSQNSALVSNLVLDLLAYGSDLWIGGGGSLTKYDGTSFTVWATTNSNLPTGTVNSIAATSAGDLYLSVSGSGYSFFDGISFTNYSNMNSGLISNQNKGMTLDQNGTLWFGSWGWSTPLQSYDGTNWTSYDWNNSGLSNNNINALHTDMTGDVWIATLDSLCKFSGGTITPVSTIEDGFPGRLMETIAEDSSFDIWVGTTHKGAFRWDGNNWTTFDASNTALPHNQVFDIEIGANGDRWFATENHLTKYDGVNWQVYIRPQMTSMHKMLEDANGNIWIGTHSDGVEVFDGTNWTVHTAQSVGLPLDWVFDMVNDPAGGVYMAADGIIHFDGMNWTHYNTGNSGLTDPGTRSLYMDGSDLWIGGWTTVTKFDGTNWTVYDSANTGIAFSTVYSLTMDLNGNLWEVNGMEQYSDLTVRIGICLTSQTLIFQREIFPFWNVKQIIVERSGSCTRLLGPFITMRK